MARLSSFRDVIEELFHNDIFHVLLEYVESNPDKLNSMLSSLKGQACIIYNGTF